MEEYIKFTIIMHDRTGLNIGEFHFTTELETKEKANSIFSGMPYGCSFTVKKDDE